MTTSTWVRQSLSQSTYSGGFFLLASIPNGSTYRRIRWSWGFVGDTASHAAMIYTYENVLQAGLVTVIGNGTETPPFPISNPTDAAPPTQRWVWWEGRQPVVSSIDAAAGVIGWRDSGPQEIPDVKVNVLATGIAPGNNLDLFFSWESFTGAWDATGGMSLYASASILYTTP